jgi:hypothetical protein
MTDTEHRSHASVVHIQPPSRVNRVTYERQVARSQAFAIDMPELSLCFY